MIRKNIHNAIQTILFAVPSLILSGVLITACDKNPDTLTNNDKKENNKQLEKIDPTGYAASTPSDMKVNPKEDIGKDIIAYGLWLREGHSHAPKSSIQPIGGIMWSTDFAKGNRNFHGNAFSKDINIPYKRDQYLEFKKGDGVTYTFDKEYSFCTQSIFDLKSTGTIEDIKGKIMYAFILKLYGKDYARIDRDLKQDSTHVQVFYQVRNIEPLRDDKKIATNIKPSDLMFYWYYDRLAAKVAENGKTYDDGDYIKTVPVGFRGVLQAFQPYNRFDVRISVTRLPKNLVKEQPYRNSITPSALQARHVIFQIDVPFRVITNYPDFSKYAFNKMEKEGLSTNPGDKNFDSEVYEKYTKEAENLYFGDLHYVYPEFSVEKLRELENKQNLLFGEGSDFVL